MHRRLNEIGVASVIKDKVVWMPMWMAELGSALNYYEAWFSARRMLKVHSMDTVEAAHRLGGVQAVVLLIPPGKHHQRHLLRVGL